MSDSDVKSGGTEKAISFLAGNVYGTLFGLLPALALLLIFAAVWRGREVQPPPEGFGLLHVLILFVVGIVVHELLHAAGWMVFGGVPRSSIRFGIKQLTPYAHTGARMSVRAYRWAVFLPGLVLGIVPAVLAIFSGSMVLLGFGFFFTLAAGGDFLILWLLRDVAAGAEVADHPALVGSIVYE